MVKGVYPHHQFKVVGPSLLNSVVTCKSSKCIQVSFNSSKSRNKKSEIRESYFALKHLSNFICLCYEQNGVMASV